MRLIRFMPTDAAYASFLEWFVDRGQDDLEAWLAEQGLEVRVTKGLDLVIRIEAPWREADGPS